MPQVIECHSGEMCEPDEAINAIAETGFEPANEESLTMAAFWLRKLTNNRTFLGDMLIGQLKQHNRSDPIESGYSPQAIILSPMQGNAFLRANIWPSEQDQCFQASGAKTFVYGVPHDHNFSFLTSGYLGPGYRSDYYEYDYGSVAGFSGEKPELKFIERSTLNEGKMMLYRAHKDIHSQIRPDSLSVSLNVMHVDPAQQWFDQYGFDLKQGELTKVLSPNSIEVFMRVAIATGHQDALDLADQFGKSHPSDRLRLATYEARSLLLADQAARDMLWREAELSGSRMLAAIARGKRSAVAEA